MHAMCEESDRNIRLNSRTSSDIETSAITSCFAFFCAFISLFLRIVVSLARHNNISYNMPELQDQWHLKVTVISSSSRDIWTSVDIGRESRWRVKCAAHRKDLNVPTSEKRENVKTSRNKFQQKFASLSLGSYITCDDDQDEWDL